MTNSAQVLLIGGSPAASSRSSRVLAQIGAQLSQREVQTRQLSVSDFPAEDLLFGRVESPKLAEFLNAVRDARAVVFATPVYKAVYSGALKSIVDLIQPDGLAGKTVLGLATGKLDAHSATVAQAFSGLFAFFRGSVPLPTLFLLDNQVRVEGDSVSFADEVKPQLEKIVAGLADAARANRTGA